MFLAILVSLYFLFMIWATSGYLHLFFDKTDKHWWGLPLFITILLCEAIPLLILMLLY